MIERKNYLQLLFCERSTEWEQPSLPPTHAKLVTKPQILEWELTFDANARFQVADFDRVGDSAAPHARDLQHE